MGLKEVIRRGTDLGATKEFVRAIVKKDVNHQTRAIIRWIDAGMLPREVVKAEICNKFNTIVKKAIKKGKLEGNKPVNVENIMEQLRNDANVTTLMEKVGLDLCVLEEQARKLIVE